MILIVAVIYTSSQLVAIAHRAPPHQYRVITYNGNQKYAEKCSPPSVLLLLLAAAPADADADADAADDADADTADDD